MISYEDIDEFTDALFLELVKANIFRLAVEQNLVIVNAEIMRNILKALIEARYYQRISEDSSDPDKMADLEILLWKIKKEKQDGKKEKI